MILLHLPHQILALVACSLPISSVLSLATASKDMKAFVDNQIVWAELFERDFVSNTEVHEKYKEVSEWILVYKHFHKHNISVNLQISPTHFWVKEDVTITITMKIFSKNNRSSIFDGTFAHNLITESGAHNNRSLEAVSHKREFPGLHVYTLYAKTTEHAFKEYGMRLQDHFLPLLPDVEEEITAVFRRKPFFEPIWWESTGRIVSNKVRVKLSVLPKKIEISNI